MSDALCLCGCLQPTRIAPRDDPRWGWVKGEPVRFRQGHGTRGKRGGVRHTDLYGAPLAASERLAFARARVRDAERRMWSAPNDAALACAVLARRFERDQVAATIGRGA